MDISGYRSINGKWYEWYETRMAMKYGPDWNKPMEPELKQLWRIGNWDEIERYLRSKHASHQAKKTFAFHLRQIRIGNWKSSRDVQFSMEVIPAENHSGGRR